ncbi:MAG: hypothetical protein H7Z15_18170 [Rhizobacter sp.]|nr:hypothetical protein [Rhizobacter sp.]
MLVSTCRWLTPAALLLAACAAQAQNTASGARPDPLDPQAKVPAAAYTSSFAGYRRPGEDKPLSWREANDTVTRIGGWRVYTREAQQSEPVAAPASAASQPPSKPVPHRHNKP